MKFIISNLILSTIISSVCMQNLDRFGFNRYNPNLSSRGQLENVQSYYTKNEDAIVFPTEEPIQNYNVPINSNFNSNYNQNSNPNQNLNSNYNQNPNSNQNLNLNYNQNPNSNQNLNPNYNQNSNFNTNLNQNTNLYQNSNQNLNQNYKPNYIPNLNPNLNQIERTEIFKNNELPNFNRTLKTPEHLRFVNAFAWKLFRESKLVNPESNFILSPLSVQILLALLSSTAEGETKEQFLQIIRNSDSTVIGKEAREMTITRSRNVLQIATAVFPLKTYRLNSTFLNNAHKSFVQVTPLDFNNQINAQQIINSWISQATQNQINQLANNIDFNGVKLLLSNAIYFRGIWASAFNETENDIFYASENQHNFVTYMKMNKILSAGVRSLKNGVKYKFVELPYDKDEFSMILVLPIKKFGLGELIRTMSLDDFETLTDSIDGYSKKNVHLRLPKFAIKSTFSLKNTLVKLGLTQPFTSLSNIPYLAENEHVRIDEAVQQAVLTVDEKGSVASAVTTFSVIALSTDALLIDDFDFIVDQPFLSVIVDKRKVLPLFIAKIYNP